MKHSAKGSATESPAMAKSGLLCVASSSLRWQKAPVPLPSVPSLPAAAMVEVAGNGGGGTGLGSGRLEGPAGVGKGEGASRPAGAQALVPRQGRFILRKHGGRRKARLLWPRLPLAAWFEKRQTNVVRRLREKHPNTGTSHCTMAETARQHPRCLSRAPVTKTVVKNFVPLQSHWPQKGVRVVPRTQHVPARIMHSRQQAARFHPPLRVVGHEPDIPAANGLLLRGKHVCVQGLQQPRNVRWQRQHPETSGSGSA